MLVRAVSIATLIISMIVATAFPAGAQESTCSRRPCAAFLPRQHSGLPGECHGRPISGTFFVGSVKEGTVHKGQVGASHACRFFHLAARTDELLRPACFIRRGRLVVAGRQTGLIFVYDTKDARLISKLDNGLAGKTFLNDTTFAADGSAYVTDSVNPVLYRVAPVANGYELQEFLKYEGTPVKWVTAQGPARYQRQRHRGNTRREVPHHR